MNITGILNASNTYYKVDKYMRPEQVTRVQDAEPIVKITISDEAKRLYDAMQANQIKRDLAMPKANEVLTK